MKKRTMGVLGAAATAVALALTPVTAASALTTHVSGNRACAGNVAIYSSTVSTGGSFAVIHSTQYNITPWYTPGAHQNDTGNHSVNWAVDTQRGSINNAYPTCLNIG